MSLRHSLNKSRGRGSRGHAVIEADLIAFRTSSSDTSENLHRDGLHVSVNRTVGVNSVASRRLRKLLSLSLKYFAKELARSFGFS